MSTALKHRVTDREYVLARIDKTTGCWIWTGTRFANGYSQAKRSRKPMLGHRLSYRTFVGPIPKGLQLDHLCRRKLCVNPEHLEPVTGAVNALRSNSPATINARKRHCPQGHPFSGGNLSLKRNGGRACRTCAREATRRYRAKQKLSAPMPVPRTPKSRCKRGHEFAASNTRIRKRDGARLCIECVRKNNREHMQRRREARACA